MAVIPPRVYAGYVAVDLNLLAVVTGVAVFSSVGTVLLLRRWMGVRQHVLAFVGFFIGYFALCCALLHLAGGYPVFTVRSFFEVR